MLKYDSSLIDKMRIYPMYSDDFMTEKILGQEEDDEGEIYTPLPTNPRTFRARTTSRLEDPNWRYQRLAITDEEVKDEHHSFIDEGVFEDFDLKDTVKVVQWVSLLLILVLLICTLTVSDLKKHKFWELSIWKWEILVLVLICGHLVSGWIIKIVVLVIERNFIRKSRVLYFVYGLRKSIQSCLWLGQVLLVWHFILAKEIGRVTKHGGVRIVTKILICLWVGTLIWLLKTLVLKVLALCFHVTAFFDRVQDSLFKQYVIKKLSGCPINDEHSEGECDKKSIQELRNPKSRRVLKQKGPRITIEHLQKLNRKNISALSMKRLISMVQSGYLSTLDEELPTSNDEDEATLQIRDECEAKSAAKKIFQNVAVEGSKYISLEDLQRFMKDESAQKTMHLIKGSHIDQGINKQTLTKWMVDAFKERRSLALSLDDTKTAADELHTILSVLVTIIIVIIWLFIFNFPISHFLVLVGSQLLLAAFIFGDTCKRIFEAIIFLFVTHPFHVGDRCEIDGMQLVVEEMNILTTVFLRHDNQKYIYPNSILATKPIVNYFRSPEMTDTVDFSIHISTPMERIAEMKKRIIRFVESRSDYWHQSPAVVITDLEDMNRLKMVVAVKHRINGQHAGERCARRALLVEKMIKVFRDLNIEYRMLPLDMNVRYMPPADSSRLPSNWAACSS
ncbi:mechanosensitive ion channel protein 5-like [Diospyros lotus]|uniref:mechanosensitive ion channel protein 5-like n=1 Tax=Diospyros lotus TaxID=55363 RepID=UPI0022544C4A|nr:mechanosensitive ion channel protein 5-like [Diospyros lotus]